MGLLSAQPHSTASAMACLSSRCALRTLAADCPDASIAASQARAARGVSSPRGVSPKAARMCLAAYAYRHLVLGSMAPQEASAAISDST